MTQKDIANLLYDIQRKVALLQERMNALRGPMNIAEKQKKLSALEHEIESPHFWDDPQKAAQIQQEKAALAKEVDRFVMAERSLNDSAELLEMLKNDEAGLIELEKEVSRLESTIHGIEIEQMLGGTYDRLNAIVNINVGQGGVDSQDFAEMLLRMYRRYAERRGYEVTIMEIQPAEEAGIKSVTFLVAGEYAYGYLKAEIGVHRLVRISPFDANARRHTSFASVWVIPEIEDDIEINVKPEDLRIDTYRAGGAGGQHVNKTDSAVRITHLPTGTVVACQAERSQQKNRSTAMKLLRARLYELEMRKRLAEKDKAEAQKMEASFGSQIRNYVLAPYRLVKDLRSGYEVGNVDAVLDGDIQGFIESYLLHEQK